MSAPATGRYHSLDALRAAMMLLGLVLHSAINYLATPTPVWPYQDPANHVGFDWLVLGIHAFRMPVFFVMAGFFSALLASRSFRALIRNRLERVALPFAVAWLVLSPFVMSGTWLSLTLNTGDAEATLASLGREEASAGLWQDNTFHLWFLYVLLYLNAGGLLVAMACRRLPESVQSSALDGFERLVRSPLRFLPLVAVSVLATLSMPSGSIETFISFKPSLKVLAAYTPFFAFGWLLYLRRGVLPELTRFAGTQVVLGVLIIPVHVVALVKTKEALPEPAAGPHLVSLAALALSTWLLTFGLTGLCLRFLSRHSPTLRYVSDSSYWLYLIHLPFTITLPGFLAHLPWPATVKFAIVLGITTVFGVVSYHYLVRSTWIGRLLNGRRFPRRWPWQSPPAEPAVSEG